MKFMERMRARHAAKAKGATSAEAAALVAEMEDTGVEVEFVEEVVVAIDPVVVVEPEPEVVEEEPDFVAEGDVVIAGEKSVEDMTSSEFEDMTYAELRELASEFDIDGRSGMDKAELVAALEAL